MPSCAVTTVVITLLPTLRAIAPEALPLVTVLPLTVTGAFAFVLVGVTVILLTALLTLAVYAEVPDAKTGDNVPELNVNADSVAIVEGV